MGQPYPLALALHEAAGAALAAGDRDHGAAQLRRAAMLAEDLGAQSLRDAVTLLARRARVPLRRRPGGRAARRTGPARPDRTRVRGAPAGRGGQSNRDIASELFISVKTASVHVSNILGKLGHGQPRRSRATGAPAAPVRHVPGSVAAVPWAGAG